jgi:tetratricopeptide (TPR) repeat protein
MARGIETVWAKTRPHTMVGAAAGITLWAALSVPDCGPYFPNSLLDGSDSQILSAPIGSFEAEIRPLLPPRPPYPAQPSREGEQASHSRDVELIDLREALLGSGLSTDEVGAVIEAHAAAREQLLDYQSRRQQWEFQFAWIPNNAVPPPAFPAIAVAPGLPAEFATYFRGALAWHAGDTNRARAAWNALIERPPGERPFKSTWAAYMLGRSWMESQPHRAERHFQLTRDYANEGLRDSAGLAAASLGWEARIHYDAGRCARAIGLYLTQYAAGDPGALVSLRWTAARALEKEHRSLPDLARDPVSRRVISAYLVSKVYPASVHLDGPLRELAIQWLGRTKHFRTSAPTWHRYAPETALWLEAIETAPVAAAEEADLLALIAYQSGDFETAERWLKRAPPSTLALWIEAKLLLRDGQIEAAAPRLATVVQHLHAPAPPAPARPPTPASSDTGFRNLHPSERFRGSMDEAAGELGAVRLAQGEYLLALDALLRSGFWMDAAYVAERVLTVEQLEAYVDSHWPQAGQPEDPATRIRHLLARRLARLEQWAEARSFYPQDCLAAFDALESALRRGRDNHAAKAQQASALWAAAGIVRTNGMQLIGTEVGPDWAIHGGDYEFGVDAAGRTNSLALKPTDDELARADQHGVQPETRFHYRYQAAELAWQAAQRMPDQDKDTARVLWTAGCWLKDRDPQAADRFYKALVIRCGKTPLGRAADEKRWFPPPGEW